MKILLIEDELAIARMIERGLRPEGHEVFKATSGSDPVYEETLDFVDLILLDIHLPGQSGLDLLREIRSARSSVPVIMLTAQSDPVSKVTALDGGADDYVTKPFNLAELSARIRAIARRSDQPTSTALQFGDLEIDLLARHVAYRTRTVDFSRREFALLEFFARNPNRVLGRPQILLAVWDYDYEGESNVVDVYVRYLRQKLERIGCPNLFTTVRGSGYRFDPPV